MKVNATRPGQSARKLKSKSNVTTSSFTPVSQSAGQAAPAIMNSSPIASVDTLIALQAEEGVQDAVQKATRRANSLLGILETIRLGLLEDQIPKNTLKRLLYTLNEQRQETTDPALEAILQQIEVRAKVEQAKLEVMKRQ